MLIRTITILGIRKPGKYKEVWANDAYFHRCSLTYTFEAGVKVKCIMLNIYVTLIIRAYWLVVQNNFSYFLTKSLIQGKEMVLILTYTKQNSLLRQILTIYLHLLYLELSRTTKSNNLLNIK